MKEVKALKVIECQGTDREIGQQYGEACREEFHRSVENIFAISQQRQIDKEQVIANVKKFLPLVEKFDPQVIEFMKGMSKGAGISFEEALMLRATLELMFYAGQVSGQCTSFAATGEATKGGKTLLGQNGDFWDYSSVNLLRIKRADGMKQLCLAGEGFMECGLNSAGIGFCFNSTFAPQDSYRLNLPMGCYLPKMMRQRTIGNALGVLCQAARGLLYYNLGSCEGDIIGFESTFDDFNVMQPERDILVHSNHYLSERFKKGDWAGLLTPDTYLRIQRINRLMELNYGQLTPELMMEFLADHHNYPKSICMHMDETKPRPQAVTIVSVIMVPAEQTMFVACGNPCQVEYVEYKL
jgi:Acyl-coenzyme A:6-aminopenicillanic acid acyl-transferase.